MTETQNVATYARIRPYNPAINEDKQLTARAVDDDKILNQNGAIEATYNFTGVYDMRHDTDVVFQNAMKPLLDYKILQGINSIFIVYGQSGSGKSFTLIGERGNLGILPMSLQYLLGKSNVENIHISTIEAYGIKAAKIGFYDLVEQLKLKQEVGKNFDAYANKDNPRLTSQNAQTIEITHDNCLSIITQLQAVSHMAPTLKNPHSSRGHTVYFCRVKMIDLEPVYFICVDLAGSEGQTALGTKQEFVEGLQLAMTKGKLHLSSKQMKGMEEMYKTRSLEAGCINNGLTQLQSIFGELIKKKISGAQGLGLRKVLSQFISLQSAYSILFTLSASANNNKVTRATLNFAKQTQLVKVDTKKAKKKIDKDKIIAELNELIKQLRQEMKEKDALIKDLQSQKSTSSVSADTEEQKQAESNASAAAHLRAKTAFDKFDALNREIEEAQAEEANWTVSEELIEQLREQSIENLSDDQLKQVFDKFDTDGGGTISGEELQNALKEMGRNLTLEEVDELIFEIDENGDGEVDFDEFHTLVGKSWFIDAYHYQLARSLETMMANMGLDYADASRSSLMMNGDDHKDPDLLRLRAASTDADARMQQIEELQNQIKELQTDNEALQQTIAKLQANSTKQPEIEELQRRVTALETENRALQNSKQQSTDDGREAYESQIRKLQTEKKIEVEQVSEQKRVAESEVEELKAKLQVMTAESALEASTREKDAENKALKTEIESLKKELQFYQEQKSDGAQSSQKWESISDPTGVAVESKSDLKTFDSEDNMLLSPDESNAENNFCSWLCGCCSAQPKRRYPNRRHVHDTPSNQRDHMKRHSELTTI